MNKTVSQVLKYVGIALCLFGLFAGIYGLITPAGKELYLKEFSIEPNSISYYILYFDVISNMLVLLMGLIYLVSGSRKQDVIWYRLFMGLFAVTIYCGFIASYFDNGPGFVATADYWIDHMLNIIAYTCCVILAVGKDLGKGTTFILLSILTIIYIKFCATMPHSLFQFSLFRVRLLMCPTGFIMAYRKYADKEFNR